MLDKIKNKIQNGQKLTVSEQLWLVTQDAKRNPQVAEVSRKVFSY